MATHTKPSNTETPQTSAASYRSYKTLTISLNGTNSFPAKLVAATSEEKSPFRLAAIKDGKALPVSQFYTADNKEYYTIGQLGRALEIGDKMIPLSADELESTKLKATDVQKMSLNLTKYVPLTQVDPVFFLNGYVILPNTDVKGKGNPEAVNWYHILLGALIKSGRVGTAKMYDRDKEYNVIVRPSTDGKRLMLHTIYTSTEVRMIDIPAPTVALSPEILEASVQLIAMNFSDFDQTAIFSESDGLNARMVTRKIAQANGEMVADTVPTKSSTASAADTFLASLTASIHMATAQKAATEPEPVAAPKASKTKATKVKV